LTSRQNKYLDAVYELGQGDVSVVTKDADGTEAIVSSVLELEAQKIAVVRKRTAAQLDDKGRGKVSCKCTGQLSEIQTDLLSHARMPLRVGSLFIISVCAKREMNGW
jgi:hypothetical protein